MSRGQYPNWTESVRTQALILYSWEAFQGSTLRGGKDVAEDLMMPGLPAIFNNYLELYFHWVSSWVPREDTIVSFMVCSYEGLDLFFSLPLTHINRVPPQCQALCQMWASGSTKTYSLLFLAQCLAHDYAQEFFSWVTLGNHRFVPPQLFPAVRFELCRICIFTYKTRMFIVGLIALLER